jgi:Zn-dependent protease with chaperone function
VTAALTLLSFALLAGTVGGHLLRRAEWPERAPGLGILAWQALSGSAIAAVALAGVGLALRGRPSGLDPAQLFDACVMLLHTRYATPLGALACTLSLTLAAVVVGRVIGCVTRSAWIARSGRIRERRQLALLARRDPRLDVTVVDHAVCAAYCVPGRRGQVVVTSATLAALDDAELAAVLHHERAHLRGRHHVATLAASALRAAFPFVPALRAADEEIGRLAEMLADDAAVRHTGRRALASALVRVAEGATPTGALGAGGHTAVRRLHRLATPVAPLGRGRVLATTATLAALAATPPVLTAVSLLAGSTSCPFAFPQ